MSQETTMDHTVERVFGSQSPPLRKTMTRKKTYIHNIHISKKRHWIKKLDSYVVYLSINNFSNKDILNL